MNADKQQPWQCNINMVKKHAVITRYDSYMNPGALTMAMESWECQEAVELLSMTDVNAGKQ